MPKNTFFNLSKEKRERILEASIEEFSSNPYEVASINQIVKNADIAKGSFYQYFENKEDLYKHLVELCEAEKESYIELALKRARYMTVFEKIRELYKSMMRFSEENERYAAVLDHIYKIDDIDLRNEMLESSNLEKSNVFLTLLESGREDGTLKQSVDIDFVASLLQNIDGFLKDYKCSKGLLFDYESKIDDIVDILESGIKPKSRVNRSMDDILY